MRLVLCDPIPYVYRQINSAEDLLLFVKDRIPPHIQHSSGELAPSYQKAPQIKSGTVLWYQHIHRLRIVDMGDVWYRERIVWIWQVSICNLIKSWEDLTVQRARRFHDIRVLTVSILSYGGAIRGQATKTIRREDTVSSHLWWYRSSPRTRAIHAHICALATYPSPPVRSLIINARQVQAYHVGRHSPSYSECSTSR